MGLLAEGWFAGCENGMSLARHYIFFFGLFGLVMQHQGAVQALQRAPLWVGKQKLILRDAVSLRW